MARASCSTASGGHGPVPRGTRTAVVVAVPVVLIVLTSRHSLGVLAAPVAAALLPPAIAAAGPRSCPCPVDAARGEEEPVVGGGSTSRRGDAIVVLANSKRKALLKNCLRLLYKHFNACFRKDVLLFHTGGFSQEEEAELQAEFGPEIQLHLLNPGSEQWRVPSNIEEPVREEEAQGRYELRNLGYHHMMRWNGILIYRHLQSLGYSWFMRLDDDSQLLSCVSYDLFRFMEDRNYSYGYRLDMWEADSMGVAPKVVERVFADHNLSLPDQLTARFEGGRMTWEAFDGQYFYNNFCLTRVSFWTSGLPDIILQAVDHLGLIYLHDTYDAPLQTVVVLATMPLAQVHRFTDWSYSHFPLTVMGGSSSEWIVGHNDVRDINDFVELTGHWAAWNQMRLGDWTSAVPLLLIGLYRAILRDTLRIAQQSAELAVKLLAAAALLLVSLLAG